MIIFFKLSYTSPTS